MSTNISHTPAERLRDAGLYAPGDAVLSVRDLNVRGSVIYSAGNRWGQVLFFLAIGLTLFVFSGVVSHDPAVRRGFTLAILFILTPLDVI